MAWQDDLRRVTDEAFNTGNSAFYTSEMERAKKVIADRKAQGLDISAQERYMQQLNEANSIGQLKRQAQGAGADPNNIDMGYAKAMASGTQQQYMDNALKNVPTNLSSQDKSATVVGAGSGVALGGGLSPAANKSSNNSINIAEQMEKLKEAQFNNAVAGLEKQRAAALTNMQAEKSTIKPQYYDARNQANATMNNAKRGWEEFIAQRGLNSSGVAAQGAMNTQNQYQGDIGQLRRQEQAAYDDIGRRTSDIENSYLSDVEAARAGIESQHLQNMINQINADRQYNRGVLESDRNFGLQQSQMGFNQRQQELDNLYRQQVFNYQQSRDTVADTQWQQAMNLNLRQKSFNEAQQRVENALAQKRISQEDASQALQWAKFNADMDPNSLDNQIRRYQLESMQNQNNAGFNQQQVTAYNNLLGQYSREDRDPVEAYNFAASPQGKLNAINYGLTDGLYNQMLSELKSRTTQFSNERINAIITDLDSLTPNEAYNELLNNPNDYIGDIGDPEYYRLLGIYKNRAGVN